MEDTIKTLRFSSRGNLAVFMHHLVKENYYRVGVLTYENSHSETSTISSKFTKLDVATVCYENFKRALGTKE
jgi:Gpi18-like mannosyltransferase